MLELGVWIGEIVLGLVALVWGLLVVAVWLGGRDARFRLEPTRPAEDRGEAQGPLVSVIIPARNEEAVIGRAVRGALGQDWPRLEVIVVDDASEDRTSEEARAAGAGDARLRVIMGRPLPQGWLGKPSACFHGQSQARGEVLCFVDADVQLAPEAVRRCVEVMEERGLGLVSLWGTWVMESFWMRVAQPVVGGFVRGAHRLDRCNDPKAPEAFANGQFILLRREAYEQFGGHEAVKSEVLEDVRLAQIAKRSGVVCGMFLAKALFRVRLYTTLGELWRGMVKNVYHGMDRRVGVALGALVFLGVTTLLPWVALAVGVAMGDGSLAGVAGVSCGGMWIYRLLYDRDLALGRAYVLTHPLGTAILMGIIAASLWRGVRGRPTLWKGRAVQG